MADSLGGLGGLSDGEGLGGLSGDASMRARDAANMANQGEMSMGFSDTPQSLSDVDTQGMGEGLSAMREDLGAEGGMQLNAGLQDEVQEEEIHAALEDEEEEAPIRAGRAEGDPVQAGFSESSYQEESYGSDNRSSFDDGANLAQNPNQSIDDIFIGGSYNRSGSTGGTSGSGGTMYDPKAHKPDVHVSFGIPPIIKKLFIFVCVIAAIFAGLKYGLHVDLENYIHPIDVQQYVNVAPDELAATLGVKFKSEEQRFSNDVYDYTYDKQCYGGLQLVDCNGKRLFIEVSDTRIDYSIFGIRPQITKFDKAVNMLTALGYQELESYENTEELGAQGEEHCFYNANTGEGVIIGKKQQYKSVKSVKYIENYKKFVKTRKELRREG